MTPRTSRALLHSERGLSVIELMVASLMMVTVTGAVFQLMNPSQGTFQAQPEVSDMQQRMRVGAESVYRDLVMAGAGTSAGLSAGALSNFLAPVMPYRMGEIDDDPTKGVYYRPDAISIIYVPPTAAQTTIRDNMPKNAAQLKVNWQPNCPDDKHDALCGFKAGMRVMIIDPGGAYNAITIKTVQDEALHLGYNGELSTSYAAGSYLTQVGTHTYYLKTDIPTNTFQLMHYDGYETDVPVVDNVVKLEFEYYGEPAPPQLLPNKPLSDPKGPWTTYGPKPPVIGDDNGGDTWGRGENCTFMLAGVAPNQTQVPRLATLAFGVGQVRLPADMLRDGPWCPDASNDQRFDADLLRIRRVRVKLRVQAAIDSLRGPAGLLFTRGGTSTSSNRWVPDQEVQFDVTPRNLNLGR
jgi:hypothetical protein